MRFVVFSHPRSGSTVLCSAIAERASVSLEPFNPTWPAGKRLRAKINPTCNYPRTIAELDEWLAHLDGYDGFKLQSDCLVDDSLNEHIVQKYKPIFIYRENIIEATLSMIVAQVTGKWQQYGTGEQRPNDEKLDSALSEYRKIGSIGRVSVDAVEEMANRLMMARSRVFHHMESRTDSLILKYEDLYCDCDERRLQAINTTLAFLGLEPLTEFNLLRKDVKLTDYSVIDNVDEIVTRLGPEYRFDGPHGLY